MAEPTTCGWVFHAQLPKGHGDPVIAPTLVLSGEFQNQCFDFLGYGWSPGIVPIAGAIKLPGYQFGMPSEDGFRFHNRHNGFKPLSPELFTDRGEFPAFFIFQLDSARQFRPQDPVFGDQILIAEPKFLINGAGDMSEQRFPRHETSP